MVSTGNQHKWVSPWWWVQIGTAGLILVPSAGVACLLVAIALILPQHGPAIARNRWNWAWAALALWLVINSFLAYSPPQSWLGTANYLPFILLLVCLSSILNTPSRLRRLAWLLVLPSLPVVGLGIAQLWFDWSLPPWLGWELVAGGTPPGRMASVFIHANFLGVYLATALSLSLGLWLTYPVFTPRWYLLGVILAADGIGIYAASSRSIWAIATVCILAFAVYLGWRWLLWAAVGVVLTVAWSAYGLNPIRDWLRQIVPASIWARLTDEMYPDRPVSTLRLTQWQFSWDLTLQRPWHGWGLRSFTPLYLAQTEVLLGHPHNLFLMLSAEIGIPATLLFCTLVTSILIRAIRKVKLQFNHQFSATTFNTLQADNLIIFAYLMAFGCCFMFNFFDVSIYDLRVNTVGWILLSAINSIASSYDRI